MKKISLLFVAIVMSFAGCNDQHYLDEIQPESAFLTEKEEFSALLEKARWGDCSSYLKLADCY